MIMSLSLAGVCVAVQSSGVGAVAIVVRCGVASTTGCVPAIIQLRHLHHCFGLWPNAVQAPIAMEPTSTGDDTSPHSMRIASHGKISLLVDFALKFLKENPTRPLVLHTLPHKHEEEGTESSEPDSKKRKIGPSTTNVARLISVVEIIKREFKDGSLHQYNEIGCLNAPSSRPGGAEVPSEPGAERQAALQKAVEGKNYLPIQHTPYMKITLSRTVLPESQVPNTTYQLPVVKKQSRGVRKRSNRRTKRGNVSSEAGSNNSTREDIDDNTNDDAMDIVPT
ncbi:hypothetical protein RSOLAG1IB_01353 [Rhizoctonia solani AG-1 IB]|uniref:Alba domain-containing protein n=1 Tax=Thanatephorus cucumeris (strain AG1-IB / isolate 7/3/14) TaxID=1108050 RepID=A0A0B7FGL2_THACB|nr:hypothetical protein RSOLAG1IB_01353 [Rhizoctonia solani AG-1 IB]